LGHEISSHPLQFSPLRFSVHILGPFGACFGRPGYKAHASFRFECIQSAAVVPVRGFFDGHGSGPPRSSSFLPANGRDQPENHPRRSIAAAGAKCRDECGYQAGKPTEFLVLVNWYMDQARELEALAGSAGAIHVTDCEDAKRLLVILGYRLQKACGPDAALETSDANRAFLTIDSGFPLADLEEALRENKPFDMPYGPTKLPVLFKASDWVENKKNANRGVVDSILRDPELARLYWAMSRMDTETGQFLWKSLGPKKLLCGRSSS
jgi:hypothetical protein